MLLDEHAPIKRKKLEEITHLLCQRNWVRHLWADLNLEIASKIASKAVTRNKGFWNALKPFLTSKGFLHNDDIAVNFGNRTIKYDKELSKIFSKYYIDFVQNTAGILLLFPLLRKAKNMK